MKNNKNVKQLDYGRNVLTLVLVMIAVVIITICDVRVLMTYKEYINYAKSLYSMSLLFAGLMIIGILAYTIFSMVKYNKYFHNDNRYNLMHKLNIITLIIAICGISFALITFMIISLA